MPAKNTLDAFLTALAAGIQAIDANIGTVYLVEQRPITHADVEDAALAIAPGGEIDDVAHDNEIVTRFWVVSALTETQPFSTCSAQATHVIDVQGFYGWKEGGWQETSLRKASGLVLDWLNTKETELTTLNTGASYCGFLEERPRMLSAVQSASLNNQTQGHGVRLQVTYHEEIAL